VMFGSPGSIHGLTGWLRLVKSNGTSPEFWSGWVLRLAHLASAENPLDATADNVRRLHSTTKWSGGLRHTPLDLTISCPNFKDLKTFG